MKKFDNVDIENMSELERQRFLLDIIPRLKKYNSLSGGEGTAYSVADKFIVKEYNKVKNYDLLETLFEAYCEEVYEFGQKGYLVPKVYSWVQVPETKGVIIQKPTGKSRFFILEEKINGRELFVRRLSDLYYMFEDECSKNIFSQIIEDPQKDKILFKEIVKSFINDYISINQFIESLPEDELEEFLISIENMFNEGMYSIPDIHSRNVFVSEGHLKVIDNFMIEKNQSPLFSTMGPEVFLMTRLIHLFEDNKIVGQIVASSNAKKIDGIAEIKALADLNDNVCAAAMSKMIKVMKNLVEVKRINSKLIYDAYRLIAKMIGYQKSREVVSLIDENYWGM